MNIKIHIYYRYVYFNCRGSRVTAVLFFLCIQCAVWNTWGPITPSVKLAYPHWDDAEIALLSMWGTITMITGLIPMTVLLQAKGECVGYCMRDGVKGQLV